MGYYQNAGEGLGKIYSASIGTLVCTFLLWIPLVNIFAAFAAVYFLVKNLRGYYAVGKDIAECKAAFWLEIAYLVLYIWSNIDKSMPSVVESLISLLPMIASCVLIFSVANTLRNIGAVVVARQGIRAGVIYLICGVATSVVALMSALMLLSGALNSAIAVALITLVFSVISLVFQLRFIKAASEEFGVYF